VLRVLALDATECKLTRVARWFLFKPKIPILVNFGGLYLDWKMLLYFMAIWDIYDHLVHSCSFGTFFPVLVYCVKKNLATLAEPRMGSNKNHECNPA
jgi:hypothetical protein